MNHSKKRILIIDDEEGVSRLLKWNLEETELYEAEVVNLPLKALAVAETFQPDLILMDVVMPKIHGGELAQEFYEHPDLKKVPIVFLTAVVEKPEVVKSKGWIGGKHYLSKPTALADVLACLESYLNKPS
jgi:CheY-like chemotaxis protein